MSPVPGDYRYDPPTDSPFNDIDQYVPILLSAVEDWLDYPGIWPEGEEADAQGYMEDLKAWIQELSNTMFTPIGSVIAYIGSIAPDGWLICDNTVYLKADYPELWAALGDDYEAGADTFFVPEMRRRTIIGADPLGALGSNIPLSGVVGSETETLTINQIPSHTHVQDSHNHTQAAHTHTQDSHNHTQNAHTHTQDSHNHTQNAHTHVQDSHNHTQNAHTHTTQPHTHVQDAHTHVQNSHNHTQDAHTHTQPAHSHPVSKRDNATAFGTGVPASSNGVATTTIASDNAQPAIGNATATNQATTATNLNATATNQSATVTVDNATPTNNATTATNQSTTPTNNATTATNQSTTPTNNATTATNQSTTATNNATTATNQNTGGGLSHNNMQPSFALNYIIRAR